MLTNQEKVDAIIKCIMEYEPNTQRYDLRDMGSVWLSFKDFHIQLPISTELINNSYLISYNWVDFIDIDCRWPINYVYNNLDKFIVEVLDAYVKKEIQKNTDLKLNWKMTGTTVPKTIPISMKDFVDEQVIEIRDEIDKEIINLLRNKLKN